MDKNSALHRNRIYPVDLSKNFARIFFRKWNMARANSGYEVFEDHGVPYKYRKASLCSRKVCCSVMRCVVVCCSVLQCVAECCSEVQCVAVCCSALQCAAVCCGVLRCVAVCSGVLQCVTVCCSALQCVAVCCGVLQCVAGCRVRCEDWV